MKNQRLALAALRLNAFLVALGTLATVAFAKTLDPLGSPFFIPDIVLSAWLVIASALPRTLAVPALLGGFGVSVGILGAATMTQFVAGVVGLGLASGLVGAAVGLFAALWVSARQAPLRPHPAF